MRAVNRWTLLAVFGGAVWLAGCSGGNVEIPDGGGEIDDCNRDEDCPTVSGGKIFRCLNFECVPSCNVKADCGAAVRGDEYALDYCGGTLGCECDALQCVGALCSSDGDCGSQVCRNGACVAPPAPATVAKCQLTPELVVAKSGATVRFWVSAWNAANEPVVPKEGITWAPVGSVSTGSGAGLAADFTLGSATTGAEDAVTVTIGSASCTAKAQVLGAPTPGQWRAVITDELSGRLVKGATIVVSNPTTGVVIGTATEAPTGVQTFVAPPVGAVNVSVFHDDYNYLTIAGYDPAGSATQGDLSFVLRRNQTDKFGGYKGTFQDVPQSSNVHAGIAGMSLAGSVTDLSVNQLLGDTVPTRVKIGTVIDEEDVPLPAGAYLEFASNPIKKDIWAQGLAGTCSDETKMEAGTCGTRAAWALSGDVALGELPVDAFTGGVSGLDFGNVLSRLIPVFKKFNSSVVRDVEFTLKQTPKVAGEYDFSDTSDFTAVNHKFNGVPLAFDFVVRSPDLPSFKNAPVDGVILLGGANVPGRGVVPLGLGVAVNTATPVNNKTDPQGSLDEGLITLRMAPTHSGLEGSEYGIVALATSIKGVTDASVGLASSGIYQRLPGNELSFDPTGTAPVELTGPFLAIPQNARYNFTDTAQGGIPARSFRFSSAPELSGATVVRVVFSDSADHRWVVLMSPSAVATGFRLPAPPTGHEDRTFALGNTSGSRSNMLVQALRLNSDPAGGGSLVTFKQLVELNATNADRALELTEGFSLVDYGRPFINFITPASAGATLPKASDVKVKVGFFKVGTGAMDDGVVHLIISGGTNCGAAPVVGDTDASGGKGEIILRLPDMCTGAVTLKAQLFDNGGQAIAPEVSRSITATIQ